MLLFTIGGMTWQDCDCAKLVLAPSVAHSGLANGGRDGFTIDFVYTQVVLGI